MDLLAAYCYGLSAAAFACIVQNSNASAFWDSRPVSAILLSSAVPFCAAGGWLVEHRPIRSSPYVYRFSAGFSILFGLFSLAIFNSTIDKKLGIGFLGGIFLAAAFVNALRKFADVPPEAHNNQQNESGYEEF